MARLMADQLGDLGLEVRIATDGAQALELAARALPDLVLTDLRMPGMDGMDVIDGMHALDPTVPVIVMTAFGAVETAVEAMRRGAFHYLAKPFRMEELALQVERALGDRRLRQENADLRRLAGAHAATATLVGESAAMESVRARIERVARVDLPVLIRGESGSGKELVARAIHDASPRAGGPFVAVNCTALPASLLESELFGHGRGAFTGASGPRRGLFLEADGGTLLLDEIGDMPADLQSRLLRVLEDGMVRPVGADRPRKVDVRILAATHQPLESRVAEGRFRGDLFYRLDVVPVLLPPLRERQADIPALASHFLEEARRSWPDLPVRRLSPSLRSALARRPWPGNVRELRNFIQRLVVLVDGPEADLAHLALLDEPTATAAAPAHPSLATEPPRAPALLHRAAEEGWSLRALEHAYIEEIMRRCEGNKSQAARILDVNPSTLYRWERGGGRGG
jgi:two-component system response regulator HydG